MRLRYRLAAGAVFLAAFISLCVWYFGRHPILVLDAKGPIGLKEEHLILFSLFLMMLVVVPVYILTIGIAWRYRAGNKKARYSPELDGSRGAETAWWLIPSALIAVLAVIAWRSAHSLDPFKALDSSEPPMTIQAIAMNWKWLFIYPDQGVASVNYLRFPVNKPIDFEITSDAPMNSFWIPQLGGQIYAMAGMNTLLHLEASQAGEYYGSSANISGRGFAGMNFIASATSESGFQGWLSSAKDSRATLNLNTYNKLAEPSTDNPVAYYSAVESDLYGNILASYDAPGVGAFVK